MSKAEGKAEGKVTAPAAGGAPNSVVVDLLNFAMRIVHEDMAAFFEKHCDLWDYSEEDIALLTSGQGETLEQYAVYKQYLETINEHLDRFATEAGYDSARAVFDEVQVAMEKDKRQRDKMMNELQNMFAKLKKAVKSEEGTEAEAKGAESKGGDADEAKGGGGGAKEADDGARPKPNAPKAVPVMMFSQPIGLEYLLDSVVSLSEYETLRMMMLMKAREKRIFAQIAKRSEERHAAARRRKSALTSGPSELVVREEYTRLTVRLQELTPHRKDLHGAVDEGMPVRDFERDSRAGRPADPKLYGFAVAHLLRLCSLSANSDIEQATNDLKNNEATHAEWLLCLHEHVDRVHEEVEACMLATRRNAVTGGASEAAQAK